MFQDKRLGLQMSLQNAGENEDLMADDSDDDEDYEAISKTARAEVCASGWVGFG
jgi:hypothetical protein